MVKQTTAIMVIGVVFILVAGGLFWTQAPKLWDAINKGLDGVGSLGADNQAQLTWYVGLPDGTEEDIDPNTLSVFYGDTEISYIGFRAQIKLAYTGTISTLRYNVRMTMTFDGEAKETTRTSELQTAERVGASGEWFGLTSIQGEHAGFSKDARTIQSWDGNGEHTLGAEIEVSLHIVRADTTESLTGTASGTATIRIDSDPVTLETRVSTVAFSVFPTALG